MTDDRMETITDPAEIRATDDPDERTTPAPVGAAVALDLDAIEARVNAATPGPWWVEQVGDFGDKSAVIECVRWRGYLNTLHLVEDTPTAEFIAHAREDVPALVAEVRSLRAKVAAVEALADQWADRKRSDGMSGNAWIGITLAGVAADLRAALATTGEGE